MLFVSNNKFTVLWRH